MKKRKGKKLKRGKGERIISRKVKNLGTVPARALAIVYWYVLKISFELCLVYF